MADKAAEVRPRNKRVKRFVESAPEAAGEASKKVSTRPKKISPEDFAVSDVLGEAILGFDLGGRNRIAWHIDARRNLLIAGYGVRQTEWTLAALVEHFRAHKVDRVGLDFSSFLSDLPAKAFSGRYTTREQAEDVLDRYAGASEPVAIFIVAVGNLLDPVYVEPDLREMAKRTSDRLREKLLALLHNPNVYVVITATKLHDEVAFPAAWRAEFDTVLLSSKIFARDVSHVLNESETEAVTHIVRAMNANNSVLLPGAGKPEEFQNFRVRVR